MKKNTRKKDGAGFGMLLLLGGGIAAAVAMNAGSKSSAVTPAQKTPLPGPAPTGNFPIRRGSRGEHIRVLQQALLKLGGIAAYLIKRSGGADGIYGPGTEDAVKAAGYPVVIDAATYQRMIQDLNSSGIRSFEQKAKTKSSGYAPIYRSMKKNLIGQYVGDGLITSLPSNTAVGRYINSMLGDYLLMETEISSKTFRFWVKATDVEILTAHSFDYMFQAGSILRKSQEVQAKIVAFFK